MIKPFTVLRITAAALLLAGGGGLGGCGEEPPPQQEIIRPVRYERVVAGGVDQTRTFSGAAKARLEANMSFKVGGTLIERPVVLGDALARGALIGRLDSKDYQVPVQEAEAGLARAVAELRNAEANYERTRGLYENRNASRSELDAARAQAESANAQVQAVRQQLEAARLRLSYTRLYSPDDCIVAETYAEINQNVEAGQPVVRLNCGDCPEVAVSVAETFIGQIQQGDPVQVRFNALPERVVPATVVEVGIAARSVGTTYPVTVALSESCSDVRSGMAADVTFRGTAAAAAGQFVLPSIAVGEDARGPFVFVLEPAEGQYWYARRRSVELGGVHPPRGVIVLNGLQDGELVVTAGIRRISDGQKVALLGAEG